MRKITKFVLISLACCMIVYGCAKKEVSQSDNAASASGQRTSDPVQHKVMSFDLEGLNGKGAKNWDVKGDSAESISETQIKLNNIKAKAYGEDSEAVITASDGIYDKTKNNIRLQNDVKAVIESTRDGAKEAFDFPVSMPGQPKAKKGAGNASKKTKTVITCDADVLFDYQNNKVYFNKNVKVVGEDGSIDADRITINLNPVTRKIEEIIAEGNVKMVRGENVTYSERAIYMESDKRVALTGQPKLVIYQDGGLGDNLFGASNASTGNSRSN